MGSRLGDLDLGEREAVLAKGKEEELDKEDDESTPVAESLKKTELGNSFKQAEPEVGVGDVAGDVGKQEPVEPVASHEDITKDKGLFLFP